jgi:4-hydroxy-3-methylbut-2-enyl diphosphate reductase
LKVLLAAKLGTCWGVKRAIDTTLATLEKEKPVYTLGELIHNPQFVKKLDSMGAIAIEDLSKAKKGSTVLIRAHGVPPEVIKEAGEAGLKVINATCPFVMRAQAFAKELAKEGYEVVIIGEKDHPEVIGIRGHAGKRAVVVESEEDASKVPPAAKLGVVIQTTQDAERAKRIVGILMDRTKDLKVHNTICRATEERQLAVRELARKVKAMVVVGGRNSGNTRRLVDISKEYGIPTFHVETARELDLKVFKGLETVGVTAGASTPDYLIKEVVEKLGGKFPIETAVAVLLRGDRVLLEKRSGAKRLYPNTWCFPGGFKRENEDPVQVLKRRLREELGIAAGDAKLIDDFEDVGGDEGSMIHHLFLVDRWDGEPAAKLAQELKWFPLSKLGEAKIPEVFRKHLSDVMEIIGAGRIKV